MKYIIKGLAVILLIAFMAPSPANADTVCLKSVIKKGKIKNSTRMVASGLKCPKGFTSILSTQALASSAGLQGAQGLQGIQGAQGLQGTQGLQGPKGDPGLTGPQGPASTVTATGLNFKYASSTLIDSSPIKTLTLSCPLNFTMISCSGGVDNGSFNFERSVAFSHNGITAVGNCHFRAFEIGTEDSGWRINGVAICAPN